MVARPRWAGLRQLLQLACDLDALHGRAEGEFALPTEPCGQRERAVGLVLTRLVEAAHAGGECSLQWIDTGFAGLDKTLGQRLAVGLANPGCPLIDSGL